VALRAKNNKYNKCLAKNPPFDFDFGLIKIP
jgi:hypothetical protein